MLSIKILRELDAYKNKTAQVSTKYSKQLSQIKKFKKLDKLTYKFSQNSRKLLV